MARYQDPALGRAAQANDSQRQRDTKPGPVTPYERAGATLLAQQPAEAAPMPVRLDPSWQDMRTHLEARLAQMRNWRNPWWQHWALLARYILPRRNIWLTEQAGNQPSPNSMVRGLPINQEIVDSTGTLAMRVCASGLMSGLTSPSRPWFKLKPGLGDAEDYGPEAQLWFDEVEDRMYAVMSGSNFYDQLAQMDEDLTVFGTGPLIIYEDLEDVIRCYTPCAGEYMLAASSGFRVESLYRQFVMTIAQIVEMFELENCPIDVQQMWATKGSALEVEKIVAHAIEPNFAVRGRDGRDGEKLIKGDFTYREVYWCWGMASDKPLSQRGFKDQPFISPRWSTQSNDPYGRSPGMDALPDIMQLQLETKRKAEAIEKQVRPPLLASVELKNEPSSILPGHVTYVANLGPASGMRPIYEVQPELQYMTADIKEIQIRIQKCFFNDLFLMLSQATKDMTAYEVAQRQQEKLQVLGPVIERFQNEALSPAVKRIYSIMERKRLLPPMPRQLQGIGLQIEYISMLALAQKAAATASMERVLGVLGHMAALDPSVMDVLNKDQFARTYAELLTAPHKIFNDPQIVAQIRGQRQAQQEAQMKIQLAQTAVQGAATASQVDVGGGQNLMSRLLNGAGGPMAGSAGQGAQ